MPHTTPLFLAKLAVRKLLSHGNLADAIRAVESRQCRVSSDVFYRLLQSCIEKKSLASGQKVHQLIVENGFVFDTFLGSHLIRMFSECGSLTEATHVFNELLDNTVFTWSAIISAHAKYGQGEQALKLFSRMFQESGIEPNAYMIVSVLKSCASVVALLEGRLIHSLATECEIAPDLHICNTLVYMYAKCGEIDDAYAIFDRLEERTMVTWNAMISGCAQCGDGNVVLDLLEQMQYHNLMPDNVTFIALLKSCASTRVLSSAMLVHFYVMVMVCDMDAFIENSLLDAYIKCGSVADAKYLFDRSIIEHGLVTWNTMISGYVQQHGLAEDGLELFVQMQTLNISPDNSTFVSVLKACVILNAVNEGRLAHAQIVDYSLDTGDIIGSKLLDMYAKCGSIQDACSVFFSLPKHDALTCTTMIVAHVHAENDEEAVQLFQKMHQDGLELNDIAFSNVLKACSRVAVAGVGKLVHANVLMNGMEANPLVGSSLINMYIMCGNMEDASIVFNFLSERNVVTWSTMISGYGMYGQYELALECFMDMQLDGVKPDDITMLCIMSLCNQLNLMNQSYDSYMSMLRECPLGLSREYFTCLHSLLVHSGCLVEATSLYVTAPSPTDVVFWVSSLHNYKKHGIVNLGRECFDRAATQDEGHRAAYVLMSNLYGEVGMETSVENVEELRKFANIWKKAGKASIELNNKMHIFTVGEIDNQMIDIQSKLDRVATGIKQAGYVPHLSSMS